MNIVNRYIDREIDRHTGRSMIYIARDLSSRLVGTPENYPPQIHRPWLLDFKCKVRVFSSHRPHISEAQEHGYFGGDGMLISTAVAAVNYRGKRGGSSPTP